MASLKDGGKLRVAVMTVTRRRPAMLSELLASLQKLARPDNCDVVFILVDNDAGRSAEPVFEKFRHLLGCRNASYVVERETGIPFARNRALAEAVALEADLAAFVDDDEIVDSAWLAELVGACRKRKLELVGGPVRPIAWSGNGPPTRWQKRILDGVQWRYRRNERRSRRLTENGADGDIVTVSNNWMVDLAWWRKAGLRFDQALRYSGGSDALLFRQAKLQGVRSGWCPDAIVYESTAASRLTFGYQFRRARDQAIAGFHRKYRQRSARVVAIVAVSCGFKVVVTVGSILAAPLLGGPAIVQAARSSGWTLGRIQALAGGQSEHYREVDGA